MLVHRLRRLTNMNTTLGKCLVSVGVAPGEGGLDGVWSSPDVNADWDLFTPPEGASRQTAPEYFHWTHDVVATLNRRHLTSIERRYNVVCPVG